MSKKNQKPTSSDNCNTRNKTLNHSTVFFKTAQGSYGLKKEALDIFIKSSPKFDDRFFLTLAFESGARISELIGLSKNDLSGNILRIKCLKKREKDVYRELLISDELVNMIRSLERENLLPFTDRHYRKVLKKYHKDLTPHCFRRGLATYMLNMGASKEDISARLGHKDNRSLPHYLPINESGSNEFMDKVFRGVNTQKVSDLSIAEFRKIISDSMKIPTNTH